MKSSPNGPNPNFINAKLLVIEDNDDQWVIIQQALSLHFSEVTPIRASSVEQALTLLEGWQVQEWELPKLIVMDLYLPSNADGWQLLRQIKDMSASVRLIPIVMLSDSAAASDIEQAYGLGISSYLVKPLSFEDWMTRFRDLRTYWYETATLPPVYFTL